MSYKIKASRKDSHVLSESHSELERQPTGEGQMRHCWDTDRVKELSLLVKDRGRKIASLTSDSGDLGHQSRREGASVFLGHSSKELRLLARTTATCRILSEFVKRLSTSMSALTSSLPPLK